MKIKRFWAFNDRDNLPAWRLPINFINGYQLESTPKFADELRVRLIALLAIVVC
jgi:hypothetical protein